jgi:hypothetical protein
MCSAQIPVSHMLGGWIVCFIQKQNVEKKKKFYVNVRHTVMHLNISIVNKPQNPLNINIYNI